MSRAAAPQVPADRAAPLHPVLRAAHPTSPLAPHLQAQARPQPAQRAVPPPPHAPAPVLPAPPQPLPQTNQQAREPATSRRRARAMFESREASPLPPFGSPAVLPPQSLYKRRARRNARRSAQAPAPQLLVPVAQSTQASQVPSLIDVRETAPPSFVQAKTPPPLHARVVPSLVLELASDQQHLAPLRKKTRVAVHIVDGNAQSQCSAISQGGYGALASAIRKRRKPARSEEHADAAPASIALSSSAATSHRVYCYAVASSAA